jgi:hypothetical protein
MDEFFIGEIRPSRKVQLLNFLAGKNPKIKTIADFGQNLHLKLSTDLSPEDDDTLITDYYPDIIESINGSKFYFADLENYIVEPASFSIITYCLGMIADTTPISG